MIKKAVDQYKKKEFIQSFPSITEAAKALKIHLCNISLVCNKKRKTAGGFRFKYVKEKK